MDDKLIPAICEEKGKLGLLLGLGLPRFDRLRSRHDPDCSTVFYCFDLLYLDGYDLRNCPLIKRKALLKSILPKHNTGRIRFTDHVSSADGERLFVKLEPLHIEGNGDEEKKLSLFVR
jgi:bifunctional non-homologous end joining protein LigD